MPMTKTFKASATALALALAAVGGYAAGQASAAAPKPSTVVPFSDVKWVEYAPGVPLQVGALWGDRTKGAYGMFLKMPAGFEAGLHAHTADYHGVLISGTWTHSDEGQADAKELAPGSYVMQPGKAFHNDKCKAGADCVLLIVQNKKGDFLLPKAPKAPPK